MIDIRGNFHIIEDVNELPNLRNRKEIFCDVETKRVFDHKDIGGMYPWKGDKIAGIAITADDIPDVWYAPVRHTMPLSITSDCPEGVHRKENLPVANVMAWAKDILTTCDDWINQNVKFDAMFFAVGEGVFFDCRLIDTLTLSKIYYSERMGYGLKVLCADWLGYDTHSEDLVKAYLDSIKSKSYSDVPIKVLGEYACDDVQMNRQLYRFLQKHFRDRDLECGEQHRGLEPSLIETEIKLTPVLFDMEYEGLRVDVQQCKIESYIAMKMMIEAAERIEAITGKQFTSSNKNLQEIILNHLGLPILSTIIEKQDGQYVDTGRPSFDKDALALYKSHPQVTCDVKTKEVIDLIASYRTEQQFKSLFLDTFLTLNVDGIVHPNYNQCVRTGRLSCSRPNSQQNNKRSKALIIPHEDEALVSNDYSQIEYRLTVHYCNIKNAIDAYLRDPKTDFHQWVADLFEIHRPPAKQLNFAQVYGMGKKSVVATLMTNPDIMEKMGEITNRLIEEGRISAELRQAKFEELCRTHGEASYNKYHATFPEIRATSNAARDVARKRGFVFTAYGRRRYLPGNASRKAFNSIAQGGSADIIKERMVAISPRYNSDSKALGLHVRANVHDEKLSGVPVSVSLDPKFQKFICDFMEDTKVKFRVPILTGLGISSKNWAEASGDDTVLADGRVIDHSELAENDVPVAGKLR